MTRDKDFASMTLPFDGSASGEHPPDASIWRELSSKQRVVACTFRGRPAFAKRAGRARLGEKVVLFLFAPLVRRAVLGSSTFRPVRRAPRPPFEVQRLQELRQAGESVPSVLAFNASALVVESGGEPLDRWLKTLATPAEVRHCLMAAAADLGRFHSRGHWHGGAQLRNIGVSVNNGFSRFDFDRDLDRHYPVLLLQAFDAALFVSSLAGLDDDEGLRRIFREYLRFAPTTLQPVFRRCTRLFGMLARSVLIARATPKEAKRLGAIAVALSETPPAASGSENPGLSDR